MNAFVLAISKSVRGFLLVVGVIGFAATGAEAHGDETHAATAVSGTVLSATSLDSTAQALLSDFEAALDSVYSGIAGTYHGIHPILKNSCYDCHSDQTEYPWYHVIPGIGGMIDHDIEEAREHLDMSEGFPFGGHATQFKQLEEIKEEIEKDGMPMTWYRWMHWGTAIEGARRDSLFEWIDQSMERIESVYERHSISQPGETVER